ncbi:TssN family type VI secretion system protein [Rapidithrix thailandica]|uniref:TssN family type VI secretion system protein n=1 Tax=Rapidithrix thailandica TaxID=413964 RepID=A0AAW9S6N1_9BACT
MIQKPNFHFKSLLDTQLIFVVSIILIVTVIISMLFIDKVKNFKKEHRFKYFVYLFSMMFVSALVAFMGTTRAIKDLLNEFVFYQVLMFLLGVIHTLLYREYLNKFNFKNMLMEFWFNFITMLYMLIPFLVVYTVFHGITFSFYMVLCILPFLVPTWVYNTFVTAIAIPAKVYHTWAVDLIEGGYPEISDEEYKELIVITLVFQKSHDALNRTEFRARAPIRIDFGRMFYFFINDYNIRNPESKIEINDATGMPQNWVFYLKPAWYNASKYVDPNLPMYMNGIEENSVIICERVDASLGKKKDDWNEEPEEKETAEEPAAN